MINAMYVYNSIDEFTQQEIRIVAASPQFKFFLQTLIADCNNSLTTLSTKEDKDLLANYKKIAMARDIYEDLQNLLTEVTNQESK